MSSPLKYAVAGFNCAESVCSLYARGKKVGPMGLFTRQYFFLDGINVFISFPKISFPFFRRHHSRLSPLPLPVIASFHIYPLLNRHLLRLPWRWLTHWVSPTSILLPSLSSPLLPPASLAKTSCVQWITPVLRPSLFCYHPHLIYFHFFPLLLPLAKSSLLAVANFRLSPTPLPVLPLSFPLPPASLLTPLPPPWPKIPCWRWLTSVFTTIISYEIILDFLLSDSPTVRQD